MIKVVEWDEYGNIFCERQMPEDQLSNTAKCFQSDRWMITEEDTQDKWVENDCLKNKIKQSTSLSEKFLVISDVWPITISFILFIFNL